jgi:hypothetical protein
MKKWIPNEMLTDEPANDSESNAFQDILFQRTDDSVIKDPVTKKDLEVISDVIANKDGTYVMRFSVEAGSDTVVDEFDDKYIKDVSYNVDVPIDVVGDPTKAYASQILFDIDKGIDVYEKTETYATTPMGKRSELVSVDRDSIPDALEGSFHKFASKLESSIREVGIDVFDTNIVNEVDSPKKGKNRPDSGMSP